MNKYRIKFENGRVLGPFTEEDFKELARKGHIEGSEQYQLFPAGNWQSLKSFENLYSTFLTHKLSEDEKSGNQEATFLRKINLKELQPAATAEVFEDESTIVIDESPAEENTLNEETPVFEESTVDLSESQQVFPKAFDFKIAEQSEQDNPPNDEKTLTETDIKDGKIENNFDKTQVNPETLKWLAQQKKLEEEEKLRKEMEAKLEEEKEPEVDLLNEATQFIDARSIKGKLREEIQATENQIAQEELKKKKEEKEKDKEKKLKQKKQQELEEEEEEEERQEQQSQKKKKILIIMVAALVFALLFPEEPKKKPQPIVTKDPYISFPQRFDEPSETMAKEFYQKGLVEYQKHTYTGYLNAVEMFRNSTENLFNDNPAAYRLIYLYSELLDDVVDPIVRTDNSNTTFKLLQIFMTKVYSDPLMASAAANFYYSIGKYDAAVKTIDKFLAIKTNKPSMDLFGIYLRALLKVGDLDKSKAVYGKLQEVAERPYEVDIRILDYLFEIQNSDEAFELLEKLSKKFPDNVRLLLIKARLYLYAGDFKSLEVLLNKIFELGAESSPAYFAKYLEYRGMLAVSKKENDKALDYFKRSLTFSENLELRSRLAGLDETHNQEANVLITESKAISFINLSKKHLKNKNMNLAFKAAMDAVSIAPNYIPAKLHLAKLQTSKSFFNEAITELEALYKQNVANYDVLYALMDVYADAYKFKELDVLIRDVAQTEFRNDARFLKIQAKKYLNKDEFALAVQWLQQAINRNPLDDELIYKMATLYIKYKKLNEGKVLLRKAMELDPSKVEYEIKYAEIVYEVDGAEAAIGYLYNILNEFPDNVSALSAIGIYYYNTGQMKFFEEIKKKIENISQKDKELYKFLITAAKRDERINDVVKYSKELLQLDPGDLEARMYLGKIYTELEEWKLAFEQFNEVEQRLNTYPLLRYNLSKLCMVVFDSESVSGEEKEKFMTKALDYANKEVEANPMSVNGYVLLGDIHRRKEDWTLAEKNYKIAQKINSENVDAMVGLATLNFKKSQFAIALDLYTKAQKIAPERAEIYKLLGDVYRKIGQSSLAVEQYKTFLELSPGSRYKENLENYIRMME